MDAGRKLDALIAEKKRWSTKRLKTKDSRPYKCSKCGGSEFKVFGIKNPVRVCYPCHKQSGDRWRKLNPEKHNAKARRLGQKSEYKAWRKDWALKNRYGITLKQYQTLSNAQNGNCLICDGNQSKHRPLVVDHCHKTGKIRGLLCDPCNIGLANFRENPTSMQKAIEYLEKAKGIEV